MNHHINTICCDTTKLCEIFLMRQNSQSCSGQLYLCLFGKEENRRKTLIWILEKKVKSRVVCLTFIFIQQGPVIFYDSFYFSYKESNADSNIIIFICLQCDFSFKFVNVLRNICKFWILSRQFCAVEMVFMNLTNRFYLSI